MGEIVRYRFLAKEGTVYTFRGDFTHGISIDGDTERSGFNVPVDDLIEFAAFLTVVRITRGTPGHIKDCLQNDRRIVKLKANIAPVCEGCGE